MAKVKIVNNNLNYNLNGNTFDNTASNIIFSFGSFAVTSNFDSRKFIDYSGTLSSFVTPITLETMSITETQSELIENKSINAVLNLDKTNLNTFIRYGSSYEFLRVSVENIIVNYPASLFVSSKVKRIGNITYSGFSFNELANVSTFRIPIDYIINTYGLVINEGNTSLPNNNELRNLNKSYDDYIIWSSNNPELNTLNIIGFTGFTTSKRYITVQVNGNPFPNISGETGITDFHIKPNNLIFEEFRTNLSEYERYIISERTNYEGFNFILKTPTLLDNGEIIYSDTSMFWTTSDNYNLDIDTSLYRKFLESVLTIGAKYDQIKTDLIARFLSPTSLKTYDLTTEGKMTKLLRIYGREFDLMREFIDSLVYINKVTYDKINNIPDQLVSNMARTFGWNYFSLVNESELIETFLTIDEKERNLHIDLMPAEIDIELWRRILNNTNYFWKSKGTREAIKSMFLLIGIPEPFINITEYVYTVDGAIDPRTVTLSSADFPSQSLPYDSEGYPIAPLESPNFYFQMSGDTDSGQAYLDVFRMAGFTLNRTIDNKKSWIQTGATYRVDDTTSQYYQEDSKLVINTKEIDISLDTSSGIEYDVFEYIKNTDFPANSSGYTLPISYINISLGVSATQNTFSLPLNYVADTGDLEVRYNGILLAAPKEYDESIGTYTVPGDYVINLNNTITLNENAINNGYRRDVVEISFIQTGGTYSVSKISTRYMVCRIVPTVNNTIIPLPSAANGDVQVTLNGIALTKGTGQFTADYVVDPNNPNQIIIQNPEFISYLAINPIIQVAYLNVSGSSTIGMRSEILRIDSFKSGKLYFNEGANKYVYKLNYKVNNVENVKLLIDGIALEPGTDYSINMGNPYEIFLPKGLKYGSVLSAYYIVGGEEYFNPIVSNDFGLGDISNLSFLQFIELLQRRMINATNRKTITDFKGGWYPTLLNVYVKYLERSNLSSDNPLHSNGYTFTNLFSFLNKYNSFFQRFVDQLLSATIIMRKNGLLVRNTVFTKQKFPYKRGVYMGTIQSRSNNGLTTYKYDKELQYFGDDGATYLKRGLSKIGKWSDDYICVGDLCTNFIVKDVIVTYPITTTTTTLKPVNITLNFSVKDDEIITIEGNNGIHQTSYNIIASGLIPNYSVQANFNFSTELRIFSGTTGNTSLALANISIVKNGITVFEKNHIINELSNNSNYSDGFNMTIEVGDNIQMIIRNEITQESGFADGTVTSKTTLISSGNVLPNGSMIIMPSQIINEAPLIDTTI